MRNRDGCVCSRSDQPGRKTISTTIATSARFSKRLTPMLRGAVSREAAAASSPRAIASSTLAPIGAQYRPPSAGKSRNSAVDATTHGAVIE